MQKDSVKRLSREEWLSRALTVLSKGGRAKLRIDHLTKSLGVTKGSFYWHFKDRSDFVKNLAEYWASWSTKQAIKAVAHKGKDTSERILALMEYVTKHDLGRYDIVMRSWALHEPQVANVVKRVDKERLQYIRELFAEMGFTGDDLEVRAHIFAGFHSMEKGFFARPNIMAKKKYLKLKHTFFTRP